MCRQDSVNPLTPLCGHAMCRACLFRAMLQSPACPVCRQPLLLSDGYALSTPPATFDDPDSIAAQCDRVTEFVLELTRDIFPRPLLSRTDTIQLLGRAVSITLRAQPIHVDGPVVVRLSLHTALPVALFKNAARMLCMRRIVIGSTPHTTAVEFDVSMAGAISGLAADLLAMATQTSLTVAAVLRFISKYAVQRPKTVSDWSVSAEDVSAVFAGMGHRVQQVETTADGVLVEITRQTTDALRVTTAWQPNAFHAISFNDGSCWVYFDVSLLRAVTAMNTLHNFIQLSGASCDVRL